MGALYSLSAVQTVGIKALGNDTSRIYGKTSARMIVGLCRGITVDEYKNAVHFDLPRNVRRYVRAVVDAATVDENGPGVQDESLKHNVFGLFKKLIYVENHGPVKLGHKHVLEQLLICLSMRFDEQFQPVSSITPVIAHLEYWCRSMVLFAIHEEIEDRLNASSSR